MRLSHLSHKKLIWTNEIRLFLIKERGVACMFLIEQAMEQEKKLIYKSGKKHLKNSFIVIIDRWYCRSSVVAFPSFSHLKRGARSTSRCPRYSGFFGG